MNNLQLHTGTLFPVDCAYVKLGPLLSRPINDSLSWPGMTCPARNVRTRVWKGGRSGYQCVTSVNPASKHLRQTDEKLRTASSSFELLQSLRTPEPRWMVTSQPALRDAITPLKRSVLSGGRWELLFERRTFSMTWQWSLMNRKVPLSCMLICIPIKPVEFSECQAVN